VSKVIEGSQWRLPKPGKIRAEVCQVNHPTPFTQLAATDSQLVEALRQGVPEAFEELIQRFQEPVYNLVYRLLDDPSEAPDVVQDVFLKVFRHIRSFRGESSLKTWIYRIALNEVQNHRRWLRRHQPSTVSLEKPSPSEDELIEIPITTHTSSPFELVLQGEHRILIEEALNQLKPVYRQAVVLRDIEDLSYEEIAQILGVSLGTVKSRILRGREALRRALSQAMETPETVVCAPQLVE